MRAWEEILGLLDPEVRLTRTHLAEDPQVAQRVLWEREEGHSYAECARLAGCSVATAREIVRQLEPSLVDGVAEQAALPLAA